MALPYVLKWLAPRGPFIFILEAIVQILALFAFHDKLREPYLSFIDNTGAQFALTKACSFDDTVNSIPSFFLGYGCRMGSGAVVRARQFGCKRFGVYSRGDCWRSVQLWHAADLR